MKLNVLAFALLLTLGASAADAAPKHRHHQPVTSASQQKESSQDGLEAFSDTTTGVVAEATDTVIEEQADSDDSLSGNYSSAYDDDDHVDTPFTEWGKTIGWGVGGILLAIVIVVLVFLLILSPVIVITLLLRYLIVRHNDRVTLAEKAMAAGQPIPESLKPIERQTDEYQWKNGIRNTAVGIGLMLMFGVWGSATLVGVGALITCMGVGQLIIARTTKGNTKDKDEE